MPHYELTAAEVLIYIVLTAAAGYVIGYDRAMQTRRGQVQQEVE